MTKTIRLMFLVFIFLPGALALSESSGCYYDEFGNVIWNQSAWCCPKNGTPSSDTPLACPGSRDSCDYKNDYADCKKHCEKCGGVSDEINAFFGVSNLSISGGIRLLGRRAFDLASKDLDILGCSRQFTSALIAMAEERDVKKFFELSNLVCTASSCIKALSVSNPAAKLFIEAVCSFGPLAAKWIECKGYGGDSGYENACNAAIQSGKPPVNCNGLIADSPVSITGICAECCRTRTSYGTCGDHPQINCPTIYNTCLSSCSSNTIILGNGQPPAPQEAVASLRSDGVVVLNFLPVDGAVEYLIKRSLGSANGPYSNFSGVNSNVPTNESRIGWNPDQFVAGNTYYFKVVAKSSTGVYGTETTPIPIEIPVPLAAPKDAVASLRSDGGVILNFSSVAGAVEYLIKRSVGSANGPYSNFSGVNSNVPTNESRIGWNPDQFVAGNTYYFKVVAKSSTGVYGTETAPIPIVPLAAPKDAIASLRSDGGVILNFLPVAGAVEYLIKRSVGSANGPFINFSGVNSNVPTNESRIGWNPDQFVAGNTYYFKVVAKSSTGVYGPETAPIGPVTINPPATTTTTTTPPACRLTQSGNVFTANVRDEQSLRAAINCVRQYNNPTLILNFLANSYISLSSPLPVFNFPVRIVGNNSTLDGGNRVTNGFVLTTTENSSVCGLTLQNFTGTAIWIYSLSRSNITNLNISNTPTGIYATGVCTGSVISNIRFPVGVSTIYNVGGSRGLRLVR